MEATTREEMVEALRCFRAEFDLTEQQSEYLDQIEWFASRLPDPPAAGESPVHRGGYVEWVGEKWWSEATLQEAESRARNARECRVAHEAKSSMLDSGIEAFRACPPQRGSRSYLVDNLRRVYAAMERARVAQAVPAKCDHANGFCVGAIATECNEPPAAPAEPAAGEGVERERWCGATFCDVLGVTHDFSSQRKNEGAISRLAAALHASGHSLDEVVKIATGAGDAEG